MNKRALLIAFHFPPQASSSGVQRTLSFSRYLRHFRWEPLVLSASPNAYSVKNSSQLSALPPDLVVTRALSLDTKRHMGIKGRYLEIMAIPDRWISWWISAVPAGLWMIRRYKPAVIMSTYPIATAHLIGLALHRVTKLPWVVDFRDPMVQPDFPSSKLQRAFFRWIENQAVHTCHKVTFTTHAAMNYYKQRFPESLHGKFAVIENGYDEESFGPVEDCAPPSAKVTNKALTFLHSGVLYADDRDPSAFFQALSTLKQERKINASSCQVVLRATGDDAYFESLARKYGVEDIVRIAPPIPYRDALHEMLKVDGLLVFQGRAFNNQVPAKIYEYFRARKPILGLLHPAGETARVLTAAGFRNLAAMDSVSAIVSALEEFLSQVRGGTAYIASEEVVSGSSRKHRSEELAKIFDQLTESRNG